MYKNFEWKKASLRLFADHVRQVCEAHDQVILTSLQQVQGLVKQITDG